MMKKTWIRRIAAFLAAMMALGYAPAATAEAKQPAENTSELYENEWLYLPETVPAEYRVELDGRSIAVFDSGWDQMEYLTALSIDFVSGDEALRDVLRPEEVIESEYEDEEEKKITAAGYRIDLSDVSAPGQAVFHLKGESEHYTLEWDYTLRLLDWREKPLFTAVESDVPLTVSRGGTLTDGQIIAGMVENHAGEIASGEFGMSSSDIMIGGGYVWLYESGSREALQMDEFWTDEPLNEEQAAAVAHLQDSWGNSSYRFRDFITCTANYEISFGNIRYTAARDITVLPYEIRALRTLAPGEKKQVTITDAEENSGRTFTVTAEGEGVSFDAEAMTLAAAEDAAPGNTFTVTAVPSDGGIPVRAEGRIARRLLEGETFRSREMAEGFSVPVPAGEGRYAAVEDSETYYSCRTENEADPFYIFLDYRVYNPIGEFTEDPERAKPFLDLAQYNMEITDPQETEEETIEVDGHPARLMRMRAPGSERDFSIGGIFLPRNDRILRIRLAAMPQNGTGWEELPKVEMDDLQSLAEQIAYDPQKASITVEDGEIRLSAKDRAKVVSGGKRLKMSATFARPDKVNKKAKNNAVAWSVTDVKTGLAPENVKIDRNGNLSVSAKLAEVVELEVKASSPIFHTEASYQVTAVPAVKKITLEPSELFF